MIDQSKNVMFEFKNKAIVNKNKHFNYDYQGNSICLFIYICFTTEKII